MNLCEYIKIGSLSLNFHQKLSLKGAQKASVFLLIIIFSAVADASPYFSLLSSAPQSAKYREVQETTNFFWSCYNDLGAISNLTATAWMRVDNDGLGGAIYHLLATKENKSNGEDLLNGDLGWDDSWIALSGETNITTSLTTDLAYCLVGTSENSCDIDFGGITNTVEGDFDIMLKNVNNNLRLDTTGNFRMGMILAETNTCLTSTYINQVVYYDTDSRALGGDDRWAFYSVKFEGLTREINVDYANGTSTNYTTTCSEPFLFEKGCFWQFGFAQLLSGEYTNMFFDTRGYAGILSDDEIAAIKFDGNKTLYDRGRIVYVLRSDGIDDYVKSGIEWTDTTIITIDGKAVGTPSNYSKIFGKQVNGYRWIGYSIDSFYAGLGFTASSNFGFFDNDRHIFKYDLVNNFASIDEVELSIGGTETAGGEIYFFSEDDGSNNFPMDVFSAKIENNGAVVIDLIPLPAGSKLESQRTPAPYNCFFDRVTRQYFGNSGSGDFTIKRDDN